MQGDTAIEFKLTLVDDTSQPIDLSGATVQLLYCLDGDTTTIVTRDMAVVNAGKGTVEYTLTGVDTADAATITYTTRITFAGGTVLTSPKEKTFRIKPPLVA